MSSQPPIIPLSSDPRQLDLLRERLESLSIASEIVRATMASDDLPQASATLLSGVDEIAGGRGIALFEVGPEALLEIGRIPASSSPSRISLSQKSHPAVAALLSGRHRFEPELAPPWAPDAPGPAILLPFEGRLGSDPTLGPSASHLLWIDAPTEFPPSSRQWDRLIGLTGEAGALLSGFRLRDDLRRTYEALRAANHQLQKDIDRAKRIQEGLVPGGDLCGPRILAASRYLPAAKVSGDSFDLFPLDPQRPAGPQVFLVADVSGHGISAAMVMAMFKVLLRRSLRHSSSPEKAFAEVNRDLLSQVQGLHFVTVFLAVFDPADDSLLWASAGHCPQVVLRSDGTLLELRATGLFLGAFDDPQAEARSLTLHPGDRLLLHTDGIVEAPIEDEGLFGLERLCDTLRAYADLAPAAALEAILADWRSAVGDGPLEDDVTVLLAEFLP